MTTTPTETPPPTPNISAEDARQRRRAQLVLMGKAVHGLMLKGQLYALFLVDAADDGAGWSLTSNAQDDLIARLCDLWLTDFANRATSLGTEPTPSTVRQLQVEVAAFERLLDTEQLRLMVTNTGVAAELACQKGDRVSEGALRVRAAAGQLLLYHRAMQTFAEKNRARGGAA